MSYVEPPTDSGFLTRRAALTGAIAIPLLALGGRAALAEVGTAAPSADTKRRWLELRARLDGEPAYWFCRGTEFVNVDGVVTPYDGRVIVMASMVRKMADGSYVLPYYETNQSTTVGDFAAPDQLLHPITGQPINTKVMGPLPLSLKFSADGVITQRAGANGITADYNGYVWPTLGFLPGHGHDGASSKIDVVLTKPGGAIDTLSEVSALRPTGPRRANGYVPAESDTLVTRTLSDTSKFRGKLVYTIGNYYARKFETMAQMRAVMRAMELQQHQAFFDGVDPWVKSIK